MFLYAFPFNQSLLGWISSHLFATFRKFDHLFLNYQSWSIIQAIVRPSLQRVTYSFPLQSNFYKCFGTSVSQSYKGLMPAVVDNIVIDQWIKSQSNKIVRKSPSNARYNLNLLIYLFVYFHFYCWNFFNPIQQYQILNYYHPVILLFLLFIVLKYLNTIIQLQSYNFQVIF